MSFQDNFQKIKEICLKKNAGMFGNSRTAYEIELTGEDGGVFYIEFSGGNISIEPYDYHDRTAAIKLSAADFLAAAEGRLDLIAAYMLGRAVIEGDMDGAIMLKEFLAG
ncbi:MAG: SCP2 sterol-binding domain-containing protein [Ruminococcaceae bacterium]|nr:SCP2 sterol-binding domain-containing protein [Oscillospiraceae bacterium]